MTAFMLAYTQYLERMVEETDELAAVDIFTVPTNVNLPLLEEWADVD